MWALQISGPIGTFLTGNYISSRPSQDDVRPELGNEHAGVLLGRSLATNLLIVRPFGSNRTFAMLMLDSLSGFHFVTFEGQGNRCFVVNLISGSAGSPGGFTSWCCRNSGFFRRSSRPSRAKPLSAIATRVAAHHGPFACCLPGRLHHFFTRAPARSETDSSAYDQDHRGWPTGVRSSKRLFPCGVAECAST